MSSILTLLCPKSGLWDALSTPDFMIGVRDPTTQEGAWEGAFVGECKRGVYIVTLFKGGSDLIGHPKSRASLLSAITHYLENGWLEMSSRDIEKTAGVKLTLDKLNNPHCTCGEGS